MKIWYHYSPNFQILSIYIKPLYWFNSWISNMCIITLYKTIKQNHLTFQWDIGSFFLARLISRNQSSKCSLLQTKNTLYTILLCLLFCSGICFQCSMAPSLVWHLTPISMLRCFSSSNPKKLHKGSRDAVLHYAVQAELSLCLLSDISAHSKLIHVSLTCH